jgi:hypothetical protein
VNGDHVRKAIACLGVVTAQIAYVHPSSDREYPGHLFSHSDALGYLLGDATLLVRRQWSPPPVGQEQQ